MHRKRGLGRRYPDWVMRVFFWLIILALLRGVWELGRWLWGWAVAYFGN